jgi:argininosuccinate lyase
MCLPVFTNMIDTMTVRNENMYKAAKGGFMNATDAADWLVKQGVPFRDAHAIIGQLVFYCIENNKALEDMSLEEFNQYNKDFDYNFTDDIYNAISLEACVNSRTVDGGPSEEYINKLVKFNREVIEKLD